MPNYYNPYQTQPQPQYYPQLTAQPQQQMTLPTQPQIQNNGFLPVPNETVARNYPVAPGNSITFKDETAPYVYTKTMGFSQLDQPKFEKYKLVKEEAEEKITTSSVNYDEELDAIRSDIEEIRGEIDALKPATRRKKDVDA